VPERLVLDSADGLKTLEPQLPVEGFAIGMVWHERTHEHGTQRCLRQMIISIARPSSSQR
jgi:DNA-binding transcriptional LysR family regulator